METKTIVRVNNVDITATSDEQMIAIRPICEALGIDYSRQLKKIKDDADLGSVVGVTPTTGADGKTYEMCVLPVEFIFGWLFTINPANVNEEAREAVRRYRMECYRAPEPAATAAETDHCRQAQEAGAASQRTPEERTATLRLNKNPPKPFAHSKIITMFAVLINNILTNAGRRLAFQCAGIFYVRNRFSTTLYRYPCTPVYRLNGRTAFVSECDEQRDRRGYLFYLYLCYSITHFPMLQCSAATERPPTKRGHTLTGTFNICGTGYTMGADSYAQLVERVHAKWQEKQAYRRRCRAEKRMRNTLAFIARHPDATVLPAYLS